jgi:hypothetical protein
MWAESGTPMSMSTIESNGLGGSGSEELEKPGGMKLGWSIT